MNCTNCGYNSDGDFCPNCGTQMPTNQQNNNYNNQNAYNQQQNEQNQYNQTYNYQPYSKQYDNNNNDSNNNKKNKSNNVMVAIISVAAVIIIGLVAALIVTTTDKTEKETTATTATTTTAPTTTQATMGTAEYDDVNATQQASGLVQPDYSISGTYYVTADVGLILRKGPGTNYGKILTVKYGHSVVARGASYNMNDWYYVQYSGKYGWVNTQYLSSYKPQTTTKSSIYEIRWYDVSYTKYVNPREGLNLRKGATQNSGKIVLLPQDSMCIVMGESAYDKNWVYVNAVTPDGYEYNGFVNRNYLYP